MVLGIVIELIPTLSLATAVNVTVSVWSLVFNWIVEGLAEKEVIVGACVSDLLILIVTCSVALLPASSAAVRVKTSVLEPKL